MKYRTTIFSKNCYLAKNQIVSKLSDQTKLVVFWSKKKIALYNKHAG